jgi:hypothetical protein
MPRWFEKILSDRARWVPIGPVMSGALGGS